MTSGDLPLTRHSQTDNCKISIMIFKYNYVPHYLTTTLPHYCTSTLPHYIPHALPHFHTTSQSLPATLPHYQTVTTCHTTSLSNSHYLPHYLTIKQSTTLLHYRNTCTLTMALFHQLIVYIIYRWQAMKPIL